MKVSVHAGPAIMTPLEFKIAIEQMIKDYAGDPEAFHGASDQLMERLLKQLGYGEGVCLLEAQTRWYA